MPTLPHANSRAASDSPASRFRQGGKASSLRGLVPWMLFMAALDVGVLVLAGILAWRSWVNWGGWLGGLLVAMLGLWMVVQVLSWWPRRWRDADTAQGLRQPLVRAHQPDLYIQWDRVRLPGQWRRTPPLWLVGGSGSRVVRATPWREVLLGHPSSVDVGLSLFAHLSGSELRALLAHQAFLTQGQVGWSLAYRQWRKEGLSRWKDWTAQLQAWQGRGPVERTVGGVLVWVLRALSAWRVVLWRLQERGGRSLWRTAVFEADRWAAVHEGRHAVVQLLHRLKALDEADDEALLWARERLLSGIRGQDMTTLHWLVVNAQRRRLQDPFWGAVLPWVEGVDLQPRRFELPLSLTARAWPLHPAHHERESRLRKAQGLEDRPVEGEAQQSLRDFAALRYHWTQRWNDVNQERLGLRGELQEESLSQTRAAYEAQQQREQHRGHYRGLYTITPVVQRLANPAMLFEAPMSLRRSLPDWRLAHDAELLEEVKAVMFRGKERETLLVWSRQPSWLNMGLRLRGEPIRWHLLSRDIERLGEEIRDRETTVHQRALSVHHEAMRMASTWGRMWPTALMGAGRLWHFSVHARLDIRQAMDRLSVAAADALHSRSRRWRARQVKHEVLPAAQALHELLTQLWSQGAQTRWTATMKDRLQARGWLDALGMMHLPSPAVSGLLKWIDVAQTMGEQAVSWLHRIEQEALDTLLGIEWSLAHAQPGVEAPAPTEWILCPVEWKVPAQLFCLDRQAAGAEARVKLDKKTSSRPASGWSRWWGQRRLHASREWPMWHSLGWGSCLIVLWVLTSGSSERQTVVVVNGLQRAVRVHLGAEQIHLQAQEVVRQHVPRQSRMKVMAVTEQGLLIEQFEVDAQLNTPAVYNVARAAVVAPLVHHAQGPAGEETPEGDRWILRKDMRFGLPAERELRQLSGDETLRTWNLRSWVAQDQPEHALSGQAWETAAAQSHVRWDLAGSVSWSAWLRRLPAALQAPELEARVVEEPGSLVLRAARLDAVTPERRAELCLTDPQDPALSALHRQMLKAQCLGDAAMGSQLPALAQRHPQQPELLETLVRLRWRQGQHMDVLLWSPKLMQTSSPGLEDLALSMARLERWRGTPDDARLRTLARHSLNLNRLLSPPLEAAQGAEASGSRPVDNERAAARLRMQAAKPGAPRPVVQAALALPPLLGLNEDTLWPSVALALREGQDPSPMIQAWTPAQQPAMAAMLEFLRAVAEGEDVRRLDARSRALPLKQMAQAWVTVSILRGPQALTKEWRDGISRILWPQEWPGLEDGQAPQP